LGKKKVTIVEPTGSGAGDKREPPSFGREEPKTIDQIKGAIDFSKIIGQPRP